MDRLVLQPNERNVPTTLVITIACHFHATSGLGDCQVDRIFPLCMRLRRDAFSVNKIMFIEQILELENHGLKK